MPLNGLDEEQADDMGANEHESHLALLRGLVRIFAGASTFALCVFMFLGLRDTIAVTTDHADLFAGLLSGCAGVAIHSFWCAILGSTHSAASRRFHLTAAMSVAAFLAFSVPFVVWPGAASLAGPEALSRGMDQAADDLSARTQVTSRLTGTIDDLRRSIRSAAVDLVARPADPEARKAYGILLELDTWLSTSKERTSDLLKEVDGRVDELRRLASSTASSGDRLVRFQALTGEIGTGLSDLDREWPPTEIRRTSTQIAGLARSRAEGSDLLMVSAALGQIASDLENGFSLPLPSVPSTAMREVLTNGSRYLPAWAIAFVLLATPGLAVLGYSSVLRVARSEGFVPRPGVFDEIGSRRAFNVRLVMIGAIAVGGYLSLGRDGVDRISASLPRPGMSDGQESRIVPYDPGLSVANGGSDLPGYGRLTDETEMLRPMRFYSDGKGSASAVGKIVDETPTALAAFLAGPGSGTTLMALASPGGSVEAAMELSRAVRKAGLSTYVPDDGYCASACPMVLAGGVTRSVGADASVGIHQVYASRSYVQTADLDDSIQEVQRTIARIQALLSEMGVDPLVWSHALNTGPGELHVLSRSELTDSNMMTPKSSAIR